MAARYWVGGTASWDGTAGTKWALTSGGAGGQAIPTSADDVFFDAASGVVTCTIATGNTGAKSITCTGFTGTLSVTADITVAGSITLVAGMTYTQSLGVVTVTVSATGTITSAGKTFHRVTINAPGGTVQLADAINCGTAGTLIVTAGTFTTNNFSVTALAFESSNSNVRTINLGSSTVTLSSGSGTAAWSTSDGTNLTFNAGTSTINLTTADKTNILFGSGKTFNNITFTGTSPILPTLPCVLAGSFTISGTLTLSAPSSAGSRIYGFDSGTGKTIGTLVASGGSTTQRVRIISNTDISQTTLTVGTYTTKQNIDFIDVVAAGASAPWSGTSIGVVNVSNITGSTAKTVYWNLAGSVNWSSNGWAATSGGAPATSNFPLAQDTAVFDNAGSAGTISIDTSGLMISTISSLGRTSAMTLSFTADTNFWGSSLSFGSGVTVSGGNALVMFNRTAAVITSSVTIGNTNGISINKGAGFTLGSALTLTGQLVITMTASINVTIDTAGYNLTTSRFFISNSFSTTTLTLSSSTITVTGTSGWEIQTSSTITANTATLSLTSASAKPFSSVGLNYNGLTLNQGGAGALTITGSNTFGNITNTYAATGATSILFTAGTTNTFSNWNASGQATRLLTIGSATAASHTLSKSTGTVSADYLSISRSTATGGATWYAGANSTDGGNNTGWIFSGPSTASGNFLAFFM